MLALIDVCQAATTARGRLCACLDPRAIGRLRRLVGDLHLPRHSTIFAAGDPTECVFALRQGVAMTFRRLADGRRQVLDFLYPGDLFGFTMDGCHAAHAVTLTRASLCRIPLSAAEGDADMAERLHRAALRALVATHDGLMRIGRMTARERVAAFLHDIWSRTDEPTDLVLPMSVGDIGDHLGLRPETVSRAFTRLRADGLIGMLARGTMPVLDGPGLTIRTV